MNLTITTICALQQSCCELYQFIISLNPDWRKKLQTMMDQMRSHQFSLHIQYLSCTSSVRLVIFDMSVFKPWSINVLFCHIAVNYRSC